MSLIIRVSSGEFAGREFTVNRYFSRLGAGSDCDIQLRDTRLGDVALTLKKTATGGITVKNKLNHSVRVGRSKVAPEGSANWEAGQTLTLNESSSLLLEARAVQAIELPEHDPLEVEQEISEPSNESATGSPAADGEAEDHEAAGRNAKKIKDMIQIGVIAICILGVILIQFNPPGGDETPSREDVTLEQVVQKISTELDSSQTTSPRNLDLSNMERLIREAHKDSLNGNDFAAVQKYQVVMKILSERIHQQRRLVGRQAKPTESLKSLLSPAELAISSFVDQKLSEFPVQDFAEDSL